jgi:hypothetical protein
MQPGGRQVMRPHPHQVGALADRDLAAIVEAYGSAGRLCSKADRRWLPARDDILP